MFVHSSLSLPETVVFCFVASDSFKPVIVLCFLYSRADSFMTLPCERQNIFLLKLQTLERILVYSSASFLWHLDIGKTISNFWNICDVLQDHLLGLALYYHTILKEVWDPKVILSLYVRACVLF